MPGSVQVKLLRVLQEGTFSRVGSNETQQFWNKLKNDLLIFQQRSVPPGVKGIIVNSDFGSTAAMILAVESKTRPYKDLQKHVEEIEDQLRQVKGMAKISHSGGLTEQIAVYVDQNKLAQYGISPATLMQSLQTQGTIRPNGTLESPTFDRPINMDVFLKNVTDIANHIVKKNLALLRLDNCMGRIHVISLVLSALG